MEKVKYNANLVGSPLYTTRPNLRFSKYWLNLTSKPALPICNQGGHLELDWMIRNWSECWDRKLQKFGYRIECAAFNALAPFANPIPSSADIEWFPEVHIDRAFIHEYHSAFHDDSSLWCKIGVMITPIERDGFANSFEYGAWNLYLIIVIFHNEGGGLFTLWLPLQCAPLAFYNNEQTWRLSMSTECIRFQCEEMYNYRISFYSSSISSVNWYLIVDPLPQWLWSQRIPTRSIRFYIFHWVIQTCTAQHFHVKLTAGAIYTTDCFACGSIKQDDHCIYTKRSRTLLLSDIYY